MEFLRELPPAARARQLRDPFVQVLETFGKPLHLKAPDKKERETVEKH